MRIVAVETRLVDLPLPRPIGTAIHAIRSVGCVLVTLRTDDGITRIRGQRFPYRGATLVPTYHPAYLLRVPADKRKARARPPLAASDLQPVYRDFAFVVDDQVQAGDIVKAAAGVDKTLITAVDVFDVFSGGNLGAQKKSLAIEVTLQPRDQALTDAEIASIGQRIVKAVGKATGAEIRGG